MPDNIIRNSRGYRMGRKPVAPSAPVVASDSAPRSAPSGFKRAQPASLYRSMLNRSFRDDVYRVMDNEGFVQMFPKSTVMDTNGSQLPETDGTWKFHLSVPGEHVEQAWNIVAEKLLNNPFAQTAKFAKPDAAKKFSDPASKQAGKMITLYTYKDIKPDRYKALLTEIEGALRENGIPPGPSVHGDRKIHGSLYGSYRADTGPNGEYMSSASLRDLPREIQHNPYGIADPYRHFSLATNTRPQAAQSFARHSSPDANDTIKTTVRARSGDVPDRRVETPAPPPGQHFRARNRRGSVPSGTHL